MKSLYRISVRNKSTKVLSSGVVYTKLTAAQAVKIKETLSEPNIEVIVKIVPIKLSIIDVVQTIERTINTLKE